MRLTYLRLMTRRNRLMPFAVGMLLSLAVLTSLACGGSASSAAPSVAGYATGAERHNKSPGKARASRTGSVGWRLVSPPSGRKLRIYSDVGWCVSTPKPRFSRIDVASREEAVILTAFAVAHEPSTRQSVCAGVEYAVVKTVVLPSKLGDRPLYDGSVSPPKRRWPR